MIVRLAQASPRPRDDSGVIPLINVVFLLLVFFMIAGQIQPTDPVALEPPQSSSAQQRVQPPVATLFYSQQGELFLEQEALGFAELSLRLQTLYQDSEDPEQLWLQIKSDGAADVGQLRLLFSAIQQSGITQVHLTVEPKEAL